MADQSGREEAVKEVISELIVRISRDDSDPTVPSGEDISSAEFKDTKCDSRKHGDSVLPEDLSPKRAKVESSTGSPLLTLSRSMTRTGNVKSKRSSLAGRLLKESVYKMKWIYYYGKICPIITQNENGPCPLIVIMNILFLRGKINLSEEKVEITEDELLDHVRNAVLNASPKGCGDDNPNHLQNVQDAIALLPLLNTGLNVNVRFTGVKNFEYTPECIIFDLLDIHLYHGWLIDPQSPETGAAIGNVSYNQLVEAIIDKKSSQDPVKVAEAEVAEHFLESTASQLTYHGICELNAALKKGEMAVLFRNNHFSLLYKHEDILCQLVTDQGFLDEKCVVWETLSTINGDEIFLDGYFQCSVTKGPSALLVNEDEQISQDEEIARQLYVEEQRMAHVSVSSTQVSEEGQAKPSPSKDPDNPLQKTREWKCCIA